MKAELLIALATIALVLATGLVGIATLKGIRDQLWMGTFAEYTRRYSEIMAVLPFEARRPGGVFDLEALPVGDREVILGAVRRYLNLCSEERYLYEKGKLDKDTWQIWKVGMRDTFRLPCFKSAWALLRPEYDFYLEFCEFVDQVASEVQRSNKILDAGRQTSPETGKSVH